MKLGTLIFVIASSCVSFAALIEECPPKESTTCRCSNSMDRVVIACRGRVSQKTLEDDLKALRGYSVDSLRLDHVNASSLSTDSFRGLHVKSMSLDNFVLDDASIRFGHSHFSGLENSLWSLTINRSFISTLKLDYLHSLKVIVMRRNQMTAIGNDWFPNGPRNLVALVASENGIERLGDRAFASLNSLLRLWLPKNHLKEISRAMLPSPASRLQSLDFGQNKIRTLPNDIFSGMPALKDVAIEGNLIHSLAEDTWSPALYKLTRLSLNDNPLRCDQDLKWVCNQNTDKIWAECASPADKKGLKIKEFCIRKLSF